MCRSVIFKHTLNQKEHPIVGCSFFVRLAYELKIVLVDRYYENDEQQECNKKVHQAVSFTSGIFDFFRHGYFFYGSSTKLPFTKEVFF